jgi:hypothetical protein
MQSGQMASSSPLASYFPRLVIHTLSRCDTAQSVLQKAACMRNLVRIGIGVAEIPGFFFYKRVRNSAKFLLKFPCPSTSVGTHETKRAALKEFS